MQLILYIFHDNFYNNFETVFWNLLLLHTFYSEIESSNCVFLFTPLYHANDQWQLRIVLCILSSVRLILVHLQCQVQ
jgi:hypothetical protein